MVTSLRSNLDWPRFDLDVYAARAVQLDTSTKRVTFLIELADIKFSPTGAQDIHITYIGSTWPKHFLLCRKIIYSFASSDVDPAGYCLLLNCKFAFVP